MQASTTRFSRERLERAAKQFVKFGIVGGINFVIDWGILNLLSWILDIHNGWQVIPLNTVAFLAAVTNSFFFNKYWTFRKQGKDQQAQEMGKFFLVSLVGLLLNTGAVFFVTTYVPAPFGLSEVLWLNAAKIVATVLVMAWNFVGYKYWAFSKSQDSVAKAV